MCEIEEIYSKTYIKTDGFYFGGFDDKPMIDSWEDLNDCLTNIRYLKEKREKRECLKIFDRTEQKEEFIDLAKKYAEEHRININIFASDEWVKVLLSSCDNNLILTDYDRLFCLADEIIIRNETDKNVPSIVLILFMQIKT